MREDNAATLPFNPLFTPTGWPCCFFPRRRAPFFLIRPLASSILFTPRPLTRFLHHDKLHFSFFHSAEIAQDNDPSYVQCLFLIFPSWIHRSYLNKFSKPQNTQNSVGKKSKVGSKIYEKEKGRNNGNDRDTSSS